MTPPPSRGARRGRPRPHTQTSEPPAGPSFVLSCVDQPRPLERLQAGASLSGKGWAISQSPIASIAVHLGEHFLCYASYGQPRPEIGRDFSHYPQSHHAGFVFSVAIDPAMTHAAGPADLQFRFRTIDGAETRRHVSLTWADRADAASAIDEEAARPWPIRLAVEECRIDDANRLRLRGWAIARAPLTSLSLFYNDTPLAEPERLPRPDIVARHSAYLAADTAGFRLVQHLDAAAESHDCIRVIAHAGGIQRQAIVPLATPETGSRLVQDGAVTLCCETLRLSNAGQLALSGWAVGGAETREIEILAEDGTRLGLADIGLPRPDIGNRFPRLPGARFAGFRFREAVGSRAGAAVSLVVRDGDGTERRMHLPLRMPTDSGARASTAALANTELIHAGIDLPVLRDGAAIAPLHGPLAIAGWAVCPSGIAGVEVWREETLLGHAYVGVRREDIAATYPDLPDALTSGFALTLPHGRLGAGEHSFRVLIRSRAGSLVEELFRVVAQSGHGGRLGAWRRTIPFTETHLRRELLSRFGPLPSMLVLIRHHAQGRHALGRHALGHDAQGHEHRALVATLDSLRRQTLDGWRAILLLHDAADAPSVTALIAADPALAVRVHVHPAASAPPLWPHQPSHLELLCVLHAGDRFGADAFIEFAVEARLSGADFVYADEHCFDPARDSVQPFLKPGWSPELLVSTNYIGRAWCAARSLAERCGVDAQTVSRFGDYDTVLRLTEGAGKITHIPSVLAERAGQRSEPSIREHEALTRAARRQRIPADITPGAVAGTWRVRRMVPPTSLVSIIIATCGARLLIRTCIESLRACTDHAAIEIVVLDDIPHDQPALKTWVRAHADRVLPVQGPFNWSRVNNLGARAARGEYLLFLNDDTECRDPGWLQALLEHAQRPEIGAVGPRLLYPDQKIQHAGMFLRGADGLHAFRFAEADDPGPFGLAHMQRDVTAITGACMLVRRDVFAAMSGFDEHHGVIKNDLDFCLRLGRAGLRVVYTPYATLIHHEMASRAPLADSFDATRFDGAWAIRLLQGDPLTNSNLSLDSEDYQPEPEPVQWLQPGAPLIERARIKRILVVKLDHIGDFVCTLPAIDRLRAAFPDAEITLLAAAASIALAKLSSSIDHVVQFDFFSARSIAGKRAISEAELDALAAQLRPRHFDLAVDFRMHGDTRHVLRHTGAAHHAGFDHGGRFPWLDIVVEWEGDLRLMDKRTHITASLLRLAGAIDDAAGAIAPPLSLPQDETAALRTRVLQAARAPEDFASRPLVCIHPGAGTPLKQWPLENYAGLTRLLLHAHDLSIILIGSPDEAAVAAEVAALAGCPDRVVSVAGAVPLGDLPALLAGCALFVGNDSGPKHLAGALGIPTVGVHASHVDAAEWAPPGPRAIAIRRQMSCGPCYIAEETDCPRGVTCLRGISPAAVYRACRFLLGFTFAGAATNTSPASISTASRRSPRRASAKSAASGISTVASEPVG